MWEGVFITTVEMVEDTPEALANFQYEIRCAIEGHKPVYMPYISSCTMCENVSVAVIRWLALNPDTLRLQGPYFVGICEKCTTKFYKATPYIWMSNIKYHYK